jgi:hypothetical protein
MNDVATVAELIEECLAELVAAIDTDAALSAGADPPRSRRGSPQRTDRP